MPRGRKKQDVNQKVVTENKQRKAYPSYEERLVAVDAQIERITRLNQERAELIARTEKIVEERKQALAKSEAALVKALAKKQKLLDSKRKAAEKAEGSARQLTPEERTERRKEALKKAREVRAAKAAAKKEEKEKLSILLAKLETQGKSMDDLLAAIDEQ